MKRQWILLLAAACLLLIAGCGQKAETASPTQEVPVPTCFDSEALERYVIVYAADNPDYSALANTLADHLLEKYDAFLTTVCDTERAPGDYEILLGDTNRSDRNSKIMEYSVTVDGGKLSIHAGGSFSAEKAVSYLCQSVFTGQPVTLESGTYYETSFLTNFQGIIDDQAVRIMSANILADAFSKDAYKGAFYRAEIFAGMLVAYTPDVLGLQEVDENWNKALPYYLAKLQNAHGISYAQHWNTYEDKTNYSSLLYRCDKFRIDDGGVQVFSWWTDPAFHHSYHMRNISWAQFSPLAGGSSFIVANTHWSYRTEHSGGSTYLAGANAPIAANELRTQCKEETHAFLSQLKQTYPELPILVTGDFNTSLPFFTTDNWTPAGFELISEAAKNSGRALSLVPDSGHFDHIFGTGSYTIDCYAFFKDINEHSLLTDHPFVYTDFFFS